MSDRELDSFTRQQLSRASKHVLRLGYDVNALDDPNSFLAINLETIDINVTVKGGIIRFSSLWASSDYAVANYNKYLIWVNTLNLNALAVQFCINQVGALSMQLWYFGEYDPTTFDAYYQVWRNDIEKVWSSEARLQFLT